MAQKKKPKTVGFYQMRLDGPTPEAFETDWSALLTELGSRPQAGRLVKTGGDSYLIETRRRSSRLHLLLHKFRADTDWTHTFREGNIQEWSIKQGSLLDTCVVSFLDYGSVFGHVLGSSSAPRPSQVARVLSESVGGDNALVALPLVASDQSHLLLGADAVSKFDLQLVAGQNQVPDPDKSVVRAVEELCGTLDPAVTVTITVSAGNKRDTNILRHMRDAAVEALTRGSRPRLARGSAKIVGDTGNTETIHAVEHSLAYKVQIGGDNDTVAIDDACRKILEVAEQHEETLRVAVMIPKE